jgi:uncharacterized repeat protein (TIGR03803 family)
MDCRDGTDSLAGLIFDGSGNIYGTTARGGNPGCNRGGCGVVFKLTPNLDGSWTQSVLHTFCSLRKCHDGSTPANLIFDQEGNLYGTAAFGGAHGVGAVFELMTNPDKSWKERVLHSFGGRDGANDWNALIFDAAGNLYGTTGVGGKTSGCNDLGCGVVFKLAPNPTGGLKETVLHTFVDHPGAEPVGGLIFDAGGSLYEATAGDGNSKTFGSVFEITP